MVVEERSQVRFARPGARVVVASDDPQFRRDLLTALAERGSWLLATRAVDALTSEAYEVQPDAVILDWRERERSELAQALGAIQAPISLVIDSRESLGPDAVAAGADDWVQWPAAPEEVASRLRARLGSGSSPRGQALLGPEGIQMWPLAHEVSVNGEALELTPREFAVLRLFLSNRGIVLSADDVSRELWGHETFGARNFVEAHVSRLRSKLRAVGVTDVITTIRGVGYKVS